MSLKNKIAVLREAVIAKINSIDKYQSPYTTIPKGTYTDPFGTVTIGNSQNYVDKFLEGNTVCVNTGALDSKGQFVPRTMPLSSGSYIDFSYGGVTSLYAYDTIWCLYNPYCVIFPEAILGAYNYPKIIIGSSDGLKRGLYLPKTQDTANSTWLTLKYSDRGDVPVRCPVDTAISAIYLHAISMSATTMVGIFNNLKDVSADPSTYKIQVGSTNLAKLSTAQKNIAINKGWVLS